MHAGRGRKLHTGTVTGHSQPIGLKYGSHVTQPANEIAELGSRVGAGASQ